MFIIMYRLCLAQCYKDRAHVIQNQLDSSQLEYGTMRNTIQTLESSVQGLRNDLRSKDDELITKCQENSSLLATIDELQNKCRIAQVCVSVFLYYCRSHLAISGHTYCHEK